MIFSSPAYHSFVTNLCLAVTSDNKTQSFPKKLTFSPSRSSVSATRTLSRASSLRTRPCLDPLPGIRVLPLDHPCFHFCRCLSARVAEKQLKQRLISSPCRKHDSSESRSFQS